MTRLHMSFVVMAVSAVIAGFGGGQAQAGIADVAKCKGCHSLEEGARHKTGPNLYGIVGRKAGTASGYRYSTGLKGAGFVWTEDKLRAWIVDPKGAIREFTGNASAKTRMPAQKLSGARLDAAISYLAGLSPTAAAKVKVSPESVSSSVSEKVPMVEKRAESSTVAVAIKPDAVKIEGPAKTAISPGLQESEPETPSEAGVAEPVVVPVPGLAEELADKDGEAGAQEKGFVQANWQWLWLALLLPLAGWFWSRRRQ